MPRLRRPVGGSADSWVLGILVLLGALTIGIPIGTSISNGQARNARKWVDRLAQNVGSGLVSTLVTFLLIDRVIGERQKRARHELALIEARQNTIRQLASRSNDAALEAARTARIEGWLEDGTLSQADLRGANLEKADLQGVNLEEASLREANLKETNLDAAHLPGTDLQKANLQGAVLCRAHLAKANLQRANLQRADLQRAILIGATLAEANLSLANLTGANLTEANLTEAFLLGANLTGANLSGTTLRKSAMSFHGLGDLPEANLTRAKLTEANLNKASFSECRLSKASRLLGATMPDGSRYDGCYNLFGDIVEAQKRKISIYDDYAMADFYGVTLETYKAGQLHHPVPVQE